MPANFSWYELHTPERTIAASFYEAVLGWTTQDASTPGNEYTLVCVSGMPVGGLLQKRAGGFMTSGKARWMGYIGVRDIHLCSKRLQEAGGSVHRPAEAISGVGTFAVAADPQGAIFTLFEPPEGITPPERPASTTPGMPAWHELAAKDWESDFRFYAELFGWTKAEAYDMGPDCVYQTFAAGAEPIGGMMSLPKGKEDNVGWNYCFHVAEINSAIERVKANGGSIVYGPTVVPGGQQVAMCLDPQGATFSVLAPPTQ